MLKEKIFEAVTYLWKTCIKLKQNLDMTKFSIEAKEEFLFLLLLKTFMESEDNLNSAQKITDTMRLLNKDKKDQEIAATKRVVNYLKVRI